MTPTKLFKRDVFHAAGGDLALTFITHGTLMLEWGTIVVHIDPTTGDGTDYAKLPPADLILVTHEHGDHLDPAAIHTLRRPDTGILYSPKCAALVPGGTILKNGDKCTAKSIGIEAVPAYNIVHKRADGTVFHPKGDGNGYILTCGDKRVYFAGDTENTSEMKALRRIDIAFLPMNLPYTMTPEMVADAAKAFRPRVLYPYHYGRTDPTTLPVLLRDEEDIDVRIRALR
jgi:L-ascorbate metabolism protein UlaG (beta-lactamase superfamily)